MFAAWTSAPRRPAGVSRQAVVSLAACGPSAEIPGGVAAPNAACALLFASLAAGTRFISLLRYEHLSAVGLGLTVGKRAYDGRSRWPRSAPLATLDEPAGGKRWLTWKTPVSSPRRTSTLADVAVAPIVTCPILVSSGATACTAAAGESSPNSVSDSRLRSYTGVSGRTRPEGGVRVCLRRSSGVITVVCAAPSYDKRKDDDDCPHVQGAARHGMKVTPVRAAWLGHRHVSASRCRAAHRRFETLARSRWVKSRERTCLK